MEVINTATSISELFVTFVLWLQAVVVIVTCALVGVAYWRAKDERLKHIVAVALSHTILILMTVTAMEWGVYSINSPRGWFALTAFALTNYSLMVISYRRVFPLIFSKHFKITEGDS